MSDLISRQAMIDKMRWHRALFCKNRIEFMTLSKDEKARVDEIDNCIADLVNAPSAEPDNQVHLCNSCKYDYPEYPVEGSDIIFGNAIGHDNVCACAKFEIKPEKKKGKWIFHIDDLFPEESTQECSVCHAEEFITIENDNFCPNCGAKMK